MKFKSYIFGKNHWSLDPDLKSVLAYYWSELPEHENQLASFGELAGGIAYEVAYHVDHIAQPVLVMHDIDGKRIDRVSLSPSHTDLLNKLASINQPPYEGGSWHHHFALGYLLADPGLYCSIIVTNQTAYAIYKYAPDQLTHLKPLLKGEKWGATWMTETQGGSDLGANNTTAQLTDGKWILNGENKYFASNAGLSDLALVTARPEGADSGPKGLALFLVPRLKESGQLNFRVRRLKDKSGTRAVPTGEVEFQDSLAFPIGDINLGIYYTLETLTVSRLANAVGAMGLARKAQLEALFRTHTREAFGKSLVEHPLIRHELTDLAVRTAGGLALVFHAVEAFDKSWQQKPPYGSAYHYARFLSHLAKNRTAEHAAHCTRLAIELFGGLGFMDEYAVFRLHREALVTAIWEGTSNIQALDMLEAMHKKGAHEPFLDEILGLLKKSGTSESTLARESIMRSIGSLDKLDQSEAQWYAKDILNNLADAAQVALLYSIAEHFGERYAKLASLYATHFIKAEPYPKWAISDKEIWLPPSLDLV